MEQIHGVDVSWMTHGNPKDKATRSATRQRSLSQPAPVSPVSSPVTIPPATPTNTNGSDTTPATSAPNATPPNPISPSRPAFARSPSSEKGGPSPSALPPSPGRKGGWFSNISSKFSSSVATGQSPSQAHGTSPKQGESPVPKANVAKGAVLQPATKYAGEGPYTPAPPKSSQPGILHVFRRLSSSNGALSPSLKGSSHGLVERKVLNVDHLRERCPIVQLHQAKLRRVAFCPDVEIAPMPKYADGETTTTKSGDEGKTDQTKKRKISEKGEGEALKHPKAVEETKVQNGTVKASTDEIAKELKKEDTETSEANGTADSNETEPLSSTEKEGKPDTKKKEKKKKSEEERKARKEKKRKLAEANGTIPMEIHCDSDSSGESTPRLDRPNPQTIPTTNPVRIYRRCCQLRETPILKKITEQLANVENCSTEPGMVEKLDLTGYWMQFADLVTLGDYLAVVPVKEVILENCGLTDESLRVVLAGLLATKKPTSRKRVHDSEHESLVYQGGVVERVVLKNNKIGPEGWKHICLFIYLCRTVKYLELSNIAFPQPLTRTDSKTTQSNGAEPPLNMARLLGKTLAHRLAGSTLTLLNLGETGLSTEQLEPIIDGVIHCGIRRLGLAHNDIDAEGMNYVAKYVRSGKCEALDLGGNDMCDQMEILADAVTESGTLWALSLAECNLKPSSLRMLFPKLTPLENFRFIDLSHNHDLFASEPNAIPVIRRYLPKMTTLKRIHFADCAMSSEQAIALAEIVPEIRGLAHISFLENPEIARLTDAKTEETKEEACALFASLLAATRLSTNLVRVDIEVPSEQSSDLVKALAKQVVAYCLRNMERLPMSEIVAATMAKTEASAKQDPEYPDVLQHLVGHDVMEPPERDDDIDAAPDEDYVIGGTGIAKALACCLKNRGDESRRSSGEFHREMESGTLQSKSKVDPEKAKETSKHLLSGARKIRHRLQAIIGKAKATSSQDTHAYQRLLFLDNTLKGIIKRFEDEFPDTRESADGADTSTPTTRVDEQQSRLQQSSTDADAAETELPAATATSDVEDEPDYTIRPPLSRSNSVMSTSSRALADEEGRVFRAGHKFRSSMVKPEHYALLSGLELVGADPNHSRVLHELLDELGDEELKQQAAEVGVVQVFRENRDRIQRHLRDADPEYWEKFRESQEMAAKNVAVGGQGKSTSSGDSAVAVDDDDEERQVGKGVADQKQTDEVAVE